MNNDLKARIMDFLTEWAAEVDLDWRGALTAEQALAVILDAIDGHGYAIVPKDVAK
jgi:hypothetical protein